MKRNALRRKLILTIVGWAVALLILRTAWELTRHSIRDVLDESLPAQEIEWIEAQIRACPGVIDMHKLRTRKAGAQRFIDVHIQVDPAMPTIEAHEITLRSEEPGSLALWQWRRVMDSGGFNAALREGSITMYYGYPEPAARWVFHRGWPAKVMFNDGKLEVVIAHAGVEMVDTGASGGTTTT